MKNFYERYGYYREYLEKIGNTPIHQRIRSKDLHLSRGAMQMAYKEMKQESFRGNIVDYLVWVGGMFMLTLLWEKLKTWPDRPDSIQLMSQLLDERPSDSLVLIRADHYFSLDDMERATEGNALKILYKNSPTPEFGPAHQIRVAEDELKELSKPENWGKEPEKTAFPNLTRHYLKLQSLRGDSRPSLQSHTNQPLPKDKQKDTSPQTPHTTTLKTSNENPKQKASSDAVSKAERSEAFSKGRRTTRPRKRT